MLPLSFWLKNYTMWITLFYIAQYMAPVKRLHCWLCSKDFLSYAPSTTVGLKKPETVKEFVPITNDVHFFQRPILFLPSFHQISLSFFNPFFRANCDQHKKAGNSNPSWKASKTYAFEKIQEYESLFGSTKQLLLLTYFLNQALCHFFRPNDDWQKKFLGQSKVAKAHYVQRLVNLN